ncbi:hypothetical protein [Nostoc sp.]|uniref:hypothetical protein n=1 Tax=Nostoc sp. TaxID=1180 RepID=UPI00359430D3
MLQSAILKIVSTIIGLWRSLTATEPWRLLTAVTHEGNPLGASLSLWEKTALPPRCSNYRLAEEEF